MEQIDHEYKKSLGFLYSLQRYGIKFGLSKTENLLKGMGNPEKGLRFIHIAGTNGKGSVATYLSSILEQAGYRVGVYTSPHLVSFRERIRICSEYISQSDVVALVDMVKEVMSEKEPPTFFEAVTAMAIKYFAYRGVDIAIMETGMGGRLDATNVISPCLSIITNISLEHQEFLGNTLTDIAREKAGIIKPGVPLVTGVTHSEIVELFKTICKEKGSKLYRMQQDFRCERIGGRDYNYYGIKTDYFGLENGLIGSYQEMNLAIALAGIEVLEDIGLDIDDIHVIVGVEESFWPGRMHLISTAPKIILDGAHNVSAMQSLRETIKDMDFKRLILVLGVMADKDVDNILRIIVPEADLTIYTRPKYYRAMDPKILKEHYSGDGNYLVVPVLKEAIDIARQKAGKGDLILITGSLFTVGESLSILDPDNYPPSEAEALL